MNGICQLDFNRANISSEGRRNKPLSSVTEQGLAILIKHSLFAISDFRFNAIRYLLYLQYSISAR